MFMWTELLDDWNDQRYFFFLLYYSFLRKTDVALSLKRKK
jgi:hypothetical protein